MVICLEQGANDLHMVPLMQLPPIISCCSKIENGLPFCCQLTQFVLEKRLLNRCSSSSSNTVLCHNAEHQLPPLAIVVFTTTVCVIHSCFST